MWCIHQRLWCRASRARVYLLLCIAAYLTLLALKSDKMAWKTDSQEYGLQASYLSVYPFKNGQVTVVSQLDRYFNYDLRDSSPAHELSNPAYQMTVLTTKALEVTAECKFHGKQHTTYDGTSWSLCRVGPFLIQPCCFALSFGSGFELSVEKMLETRFNCQVLAFDPTVAPKYQRDTDKFLHLREGLQQSGSVDAFYTDSLRGHLQRLGAENFLIDVLKMDVGDAWLHAVSTAVSDGSLKFVKQLLLAVTIPKRFSVRRLQEESRVIQSLRQVGFRLWFYNVKYRFQRGQVLRYDQPTGRHYKMVYFRQLHFINVNFVTSNWSLRNAIQGRLDNPLVKLPIVKLPGLQRLGAMRRQNLTLFSAVELEEFYYELVQQLHVHCPRSLRIGDILDGGWDVCFSAPFDITKRRPCVAFSFGINHIYEYDDQLADEYRCKVYMFDPSMEIDDYQRREASWFFNVGLAANSTELPNGWKMQTLCALFDTLGYSDKEVDILKIDIEYWEWESLEKALADGCLARVRQLMLETHTAALSNSQSDYARYIRILMGLFDLGFATWNSHLNVQSVYGNSTGVLRPCCYENYLVNTRLLHL